MRLNPEQLCSPRKRLCYSVCVCLLIVIFLPILVMESKDVTITFTCKNIHTTIDGDGNSQITYTSDNISHVVVGLRLPVPCKCARNQILDTCVIEIVSCLGFFHSLLSLCPSSFLSDLLSFCITSTHAKAGSSLRQRSKTQRLYNMTVDIRRQTVRLRGTSNTQMRRFKSFLFIRYLLTY